MKKLQYLLLAFLICSIPDIVPDVNGQIIVFQKEYDLPSELYTKDFKSGIGTKRYFDDNGDLIIQTMYTKNWNIYTHNLTKGIIDSIDVNIFGYQFIDNFNFISPDSILIAFSPTYLRHNHDLSLLLINKDKTILDTLSLQGLPVKLKGNNLLKDKRYSMSFFYFPISINSGKMYIPLLRWAGEDLCNPYDSVIGIVPYHSFAPVRRLPIRPQCAPKGLFWGYEYLEPRGVCAKNNLYVFFGNAPIIYRYSPDRERLDSIRCSFATIQEIPPYRKGVERASGSDGYRSMYDYLMYDFIQDQFVFVARVGCDSTDSPLAAQSSNFIYSFIILDSNLNKIGEGVVPEGYYPIFISYKEGYLLKKKDEEKVIYTYFTYRQVEEDPIVLTDEIASRRMRMAELAPYLPKEVALRSYFNEMIGEEGHLYKKFIAIPETSCPQCQPMYAEILGKYKHQLEAKKIAVVLIGNVKMAETIKEMMLPKESVITWDSQRVAPLYTDSERLYEKYLDLWVNLRYIEFDEFDRIIDDKIFNPGDMQDLINLLAE